MKNRNAFKSPYFKKTVHPILSASLKWASALLMLHNALEFDTPLMCKYRTIAMLFIPMLSIIFIIRAFRTMGGCRGRILITCEKSLFILVLLSATFILTQHVVVFQYKKRVVLNTTEDLLNKLGRHFIVGYRAQEDIERLLEKGALGGVYITARNIENKSVTEVRRELWSFQAIALGKGLPPLFLAADQEGGKVSRLSPLLPPMPALSSVIHKASATTGTNDGVQAYAARQAKQLAGLGINLNLSPVVDLKTHHPNHKRNTHSRIDQRAISADISTVTAVAGTYCSTLIDNGVRPTLKHFPGLGRVAEDTHFNTGTLGGSRDFLERNDWRPFREIIAQTNPFIMLGHVRVSTVDPDLPASISPKIITDIIRNEWKFEGILITDDMNMGAIADRKEGIGQSAIRALNAGADLILLSYDGRQYYNAMYAVIKAYEKGFLDETILKKSRQRIFAFRPTKALQHRPVAGILMGD